MNIFRDPKSRNLNISSDLCIQPSFKKIQIFIFARFSFTILYSEVALLLYYVIFRTTNLLVKSFKVKWLGPLGTQTSGVQFCLENISFPNFHCLLTPKVSKQHNFNNDLPKLSPTRHLSATPAALRNCIKWRPWFYTLLNSFTLLDGIFYDL